MRNARSLFHRLLIPILAVTAMSALIPTTSVSAHVFLKSAQPAADQVLAQPPARVILTFSGDLDSRGSTLTVVDGSGTQVDLGNVAVDAQNRAILTVSLKALTSGVYQVRYTAVSAADGHATVGNYRFGVGAVTLTPYALNRACAPLPTLTTISGEASVHFVSPPDNSTLATTRLDFILDTQNFNLGSNGNYADVWLDGQRVQRIESISGHSLDVPNGIHDLCVALVDGVTGQEIGARAGIRVVVRTGTAPDTAASLPLWVILAILLGL